jgi:acyl-coenzyme A thioesterase PaaI-like protein
MPPSNRLSRTVHRMDNLPAGLRAWLISYAFGSTVRFVRTAGVRFLDLTEERALLTLPNRRKVQNHIHTAHAAAVALLGETATGAVFGMSVPDDKIPLLKSMRIHYVKLSKGDLRAEATLSAAERERILSDEKGDIAVPVKITDQTGEATVEAEFIWAWRSKKR